MRKTILELDLVGYSTVCDSLEQALDVNTISKLNQQIQSFVEIGLKEAGVSRRSAVMATTGDGAILLFDSPAIAHRVAAAVHAATETHNRGKPDLAKRVFRSGAATGEIAKEKKKGGGGFEIAGTTIARAVRLEAKAKPGALLADHATFLGLDPIQKRAYGKGRRVSGKRDEEFLAFESQLYSAGPANAAHFNRTKPSLSKVLPKLVAKFTEEDGELCSLSDEDTPAYWMELWVEDAPSETRSVTFEILDSGFDEPRWTVKRAARHSASPREFLTDEMNSWGDVDILARGMGPGARSWSIRTTLYQALLRHYGRRSKNDDVRHALKQIHDE